MLKKMQEAARAVGGVIAALAMFAAVLVGFVAVADADPFEGARSSSAEAAAEIGATINRLRAEVYQLGPIEYQPFAEGVEKTYAECVLTAANDTSTFSPFNVNLVHFPPSCEYDNPGVSENLAFGWASNGTNFNAAVDQWNNSESGHRGAMLSDAAVMRVDVLCVGETYFAVAFFEPATRNGNSPTSGTQAAAQPANEPAGDGLGPFYRTSGYTCSGGVITAPDGTPAPVAPAPATPNVQTTPDSVSPAEAAAPTAKPAAPITAITGMKGTEGQVARSYKAIFGRLPDGDGFQYWIDVRKNGASMWSVTRAFVSSPEYQANTTRWPEGLTNEQYVDKLYENILGRPSDAAGKAFWVRLLGTRIVGRHLMLIAFIQSGEFVQMTGTS